MRIVRLVRILRLIMILNRRFSFFDQMLKKYKIDNLIISVVAILFLAALPMRHIEPSFDSYADALWWAIDTMTTVGYGDLYPETTVGRLIASVLMLIGIGIIGLVTGTVASIFTRSKDELLPKELLDVKRLIGSYPSLDRTAKERRREGHPRSTVVSSHAIPVFLLTPPALLCCNFSVS